MKYVNPNYYDLDGHPMLVSIAKATGKVTSDSHKPTPVEDLKYSEEGTELLRAPEELPQGFNKDDKPGYFAVQYSLDDGNTWTDSIPKGRGGDYTIKVIYIGDKNHNDFIGDYSLKVTVQNLYVGNDTVWTKGSYSGDLIVYRAMVHNKYLVN